MTTPQKMFAAAIILLCVLIPLGRRLSSGAPAPASTTSAQMPHVLEAVPLTAFADQDTRGWSTVPRGTQDCNGVKFVCDGAIRTAGLLGARGGKGYSGAVLNIPMNCRGTRIHLLQASENSSGALEGTPYGRMILHYANGETRRLDLLFAVHGRDWMRSPGREDLPVLDKNTRIGWSEPHPRKGVIIRFYHTTFANPLPDIEITTVDFISPLYSANLLLFGLAVDHDPRLLSPPWQPGEAVAVIQPADQIVVTVQDAASRPLPGATLAWTALARRIQVDFPPLGTDAQGRILLEFQRAALRQISYIATAPDGKTASGEFECDDTGNFPPSAVIKIIP